MYPPHTITCIKKIEITVFCDKMVKPGCRYNPCYFGKKKTSGRNLKAGETEKDNDQKSKGCVVNQQQTVILKRKDG